MINLFHILPQGFNVGNEAIRVATRWLLQRAFGEVVNVITVPATSRFESHARAGLTAAMVHEINQFADGVIVGGGNLYENGQLAVDLHALKQLQPPLMVFSVSWGRIYDRHASLVPRTDAMPDHIVKGLNDVAEFSLARDTATLNYLHGLGAARVQLGGCPTVFLDEIVESLPSLPSDDGGALVSLRHPDLMNIPLPLRARVHDDIRRIVEWLRDCGYDSVRLLCHDHRDIPFAVSFGGVEWLYTDDVRTYLALLRASALNVGYRLHAALPCAAVGTPFIKISYDERSLSLMETVGLGEWNIDLTKTTDLLADLEQRHAALNRLQEILRTAWTEAKVERGQVMNASFNDFAKRVSEYRYSR